MAHRTIAGWPPLKPARVLDAPDVRRLMRHICLVRYPLRSNVIVSLSFKVGLRACEIAGLDWSMVLRPDGKIDRHIMVARQIAKMGSGRMIPLNPELHSALERLHIDQDKPRRGALVRSERGSHMRAQSIVNWFAAVYAELGFYGCSSHPGRRTFITKSARLLGRTGGSLKHIQELAGHRSLSTTERSIAGDRIQHKLVQLV